MTSHSKKYPDRSRLSKIQSSGHYQNNQNEVAVHIPSPNPSFNDRLPHDDQSDANRKNDERTGAIPRDENASQTGQISGRVKLARHWRKDLRHTSNRIARIFDQPRRDRKRRNRCRRNKRANNHRIGLKPQLFRRQNRERKCPVSSHLAKSAPLDGTHTQPDRQRMKRQTSEDQITEDIHRDRDRADRQQSAAAHQRDYDQDSAQQRDPNLAQLQPRELLQSFKRPRKNCERKSCRNPRSGQQEQRPRILE